MLESAIITRLSQRKWETGLGMFGAKVLKTNDCAGINIQSQTESDAEGVGRTTLKGRSVHIGRNNNSSIPPKIKKYARGGRRWRLVKAFIISAYQR
jgi:hypothetical protein